MKNNMINKLSVHQLVILLALSTPGATLAGHPLSSDDTGTQGRGNFQLELNGQYDHDKEDSVTTTGGQVASALSYGIAESLDIVIGTPYLWNKEESDDQSVDSSENGISDTSLDIKFRFYEEDGLSFAVKPGLSFPTGDDDKGLGAGKMGYHLYLIGMKESGPWSFLANLGYIRNETDSESSEKNIWHASVAAIYTLNDQWKVAADLVAERNSDKDNKNDPVSSILGVIYSPTKDIDLDCGVKTGLTSSETDWSLLAGVTFRF